ncbi:MAG: TfoX/Sxy family protein [Sphingopyxis sp.]
MQVNDNPQDRKLTLESNVRRVLENHDYDVRNMFGGKTFMLSGNMLCCVSSKGLMVRIDPKTEQAALARDHAEPCLGAGRRMAGFIMVDHSGLTKLSAVKSWVELALRYVEPMPPKEKKSKLKLGGKNNARIFSPN